MKLIVKLMSQFLNFRSFIFFAANAAFLAGNVWFFWGQEERNNETSMNTSFVERSPSEITSPRQARVNFLPVINSAENRGYYPFPRTENNASIIPSEISASDAEAAEAQAALKENKPAEFQKLKQQEAMLIALVEDNKRLKTQLLALGNTLNTQAEDLKESQQRETLLNETIANERIKSASLSNSPINRIKRSIDQQPDLLTVQVVPESVDLKALDASLEGDVTASELALELREDHAEQVIEPDNVSGAVEFGFYYDQDNQVTQGIQGRLILDYDEGNAYNVNSDIKFEFESEDDEMSTEKFRWQFQTDYHLDPIHLVFARSDIQRSKFASYKREETFTVGYGRLFFNENNHKFNTELGPGYKFAVPNVGKDAVSMDEFIIRTRLNYERIISDNLQITLEGVLEFGHSNSVSSIEFRAQNRIYQQLYLIFDINYKYNENVPVDTVNQEVSSGFNIMYGF